MTQTQVAYWNYKENQKHNRATEAEDQRSHLADEFERALHNRETERETHRHYLATETETERADRANEFIKTEQLNETIRSDVANESINRFKAEEQQRTNLANEQISRDRNAETSRHDKASEANEAARTAETVRHDKRVEEYTAKDNIWSNILSALNSLSGSRVLTELLKQSSETPGLTKEQKDRIIAETEYWKARTEAERSRTGVPSRTQWTPTTVYDTYKQFISDTFAPDVGKRIQQYLGGTSWQ